MKIMSVDYGDVRTGLAVCDKSEFLASPLTVITEYNADKLAEKIAEYVKTEKPERLVVGLPKNMDGSEGGRAEKCREFGDKLHALTGVETIMWDERCTTVSAHQILNETNVRGKKRKAVVDAVAAVIILESYLEYRKNNPNA